MSEWFWRRLDWIDRLTRHKVPWLCDKVLDYENENGRLTCSCGKPIAHGWDCVR